MNYKIVIGIVLFLFAISLISAPQTATATQDIQPEDIGILVVVGPSFGWSYYELKEIFDDWGCTFVTTGETETVASCFNRAPRPVDVDILVSEIDEDYLSDFDCLMIPSGGHWGGLCDSEPVLELINMAYDEDLFISGICTGIGPIGAAGDMLNGTKITGHGNTRSEVRTAGAYLDPLSRVIIDGQFITGGPGGGMAAGYEYAPHYDFSLNVIRAIIGDSYLFDVSTGPNPDGRVINVNTDDHSLLLDNLYSLDVEEVKVKVYPANNHSDVTSFTLNATDVDGDYAGILSGLDETSYIVDLEIETNNRTVEIHRDVATFDYTTPTAAVTIPVELIVGIGGTLAVGVVVILILFKRRQS